MDKNKKNCSHLSISNFVFYFNSFSLSISAQRNTHIKMSNIDQSVQEQLEFYGFKYPQITITKRQRLIELANEQLAQNGFSHRNWSIQKMQGVINFDDIYNTGEFDNCNVSVHDLQELYESIKSKTRTTRYYNELYDDLLEESRTLRLSKPSNVFAIYYKQKHASYKQKYPELKGHQLFSKAAMDFKNLKDSFWII